MLAVAIPQRRPITPPLARRRGRIPVHTTPPLPRRRPTRTTAAAPHWTDVFRTMLMRRAGVREAGSEFAR